VIAVAWILALALLPRASESLKSPSPEAAAKQPAPAHVMVTTGHGPAIARR
jgi:hypothetical protein